MTEVCGGGRFSYVSDEKMHADSDRKGSLVLFLGTMTLTSGAVNLILPLICTTLQRFLEKQPLTRYIPHRNQIILDRSFNCGTVLDSSSTNIVSRKVVQPFRERYVP